jgi:hypothetical protein
MAFVFGFPRFHGVQSHIDGQYFSVWRYVCVININIQYIVCEMIQQILRSTIPPARNDLVARNMF